MKNKQKIDKLISTTFPPYCGRIIAATIASTLSSFVDGCIIGKMLGADSMAAFGIAMPFILIIIVVPGIILSSGGSICASILIGENNTRRKNANFTACCLASAVIGLFGTILCLTCPQFLVSLTSATGTVASEAMAYIRGYSLGAIPTILLSVLLYYANLDGHENMSLIAVAIMTVSDIILDLALGVYFGWGLFGMALATSISYILAVAYFVLQFIRGRSTFSLSFYNLKKELSEMLRYGYPSALNTLLISIRCFLINMLLISIAGQSAVSAYSFQSNFNQFFIAIASGISTTVSALTGIFIGEKDRRKIDSSVLEGFKINIILTSVLLLILFFGAPLLTQLLMEGTQIQKEYACNALRLFSLSMPFSGMCIIFISLYQTLGNRKLANLIAIGHGLLFIILSALVLSSFLGLDGVWLSVLAGEVLVLVVLYVYTWIVQREMPRNLCDMIIMEENLLENEEDVFRADSDMLNFAGMTELGTGLAVYLKKHEVSCSVIDACMSALKKLIGTNFQQLPEDGNFFTNRIKKTGKAEIIDVQSYLPVDKEPKPQINIRFTGEEMYSSLSDGLGDDIREELKKYNMNIYYRYGTGISFVNIGMEE